MKAGREGIKAQSPSKRQPHANTTVKAVKCSVRAFPEAAGSGEQHAESWRELASTFGYYCRSMEPSAILTAGDSGGRATELWRKMHGSIIGGRLTAEKHTA